MGNDQKTITTEEHIGQLNAKVREKISAYAEEKGITYEEAASRAYMTVNGIKIEPINAADLEFDSEKEGEK